MLFPKLFAVTKPWFYHNFLCSFGFLSLISTKYTFVWNYFTVFNYCFTTTYSRKILKNWVLKLYYWVEIYGWIVQVEIDNVEQSRKDLRNKLLGRIDEVQDDVKQIKQLVDTNLDDVANKLLAKSTKETVTSIWLFQIL